MSLHINGQLAQRAAPAGAVPAHLPARAGLARREERLRHRRLRRLHRARGRGPGAQLHLPGPARARPRGDDDRGPGPRAAGRRFPGRPGLPVRLLHPGDDHDRGGADRGGPRRPPPRVQGEHLPVHRLRLDRGRAGRPGARRRRFRSLRNGRPVPGGRRPARARRPGRGDRPGPVHAGHLDPGAAAHEAGALPAPARPDPLGRRGAALALPGVAAVLSYPDSPLARYSTARHHHPGDDACDTLLFDQTVRFTGQRVAAVVADSPHTAALACELVRVDYEVLPAVIDPDLAMAPGAPVLHPGLLPGAGMSDPERNVAAEVHGGSGDLAAGFAAADTTYEQTFRVQRVQHVHLETHATIGWMDEGRLVLRTSSQTPFLTRDALCGLFGLERSQVRVLAARIGGGFGGKQEMLTEDVVALAVLRLGRPVQLEFTREEQFTAATTRHPMRITVRLGARRDGTLTAMQLRTVADTGAYGNHAGGVLFHSCNEAISMYRCPAKRVDGWSVYTNTVPAGAFRGYGLSQSVFAVESALDELARALGLDPLDVRRRNVVRPGDPLLAASDQPGGRADRQLRAGRVPGPGAGRAGQRAGAARAGGGRLADRHRRRGQHAGHGAARGAPGPCPDRAAGRGWLPARGRHGRVRQRDHDRAPAAGRGRAGLRRGRHRDRVRRHRRGRARHRRVRVHRDVRGRDGHAARRAGAGGTAGRGRGGHRGRARGGRQADGGRGELRRPGPLGHLQRAGLPGRGAARHRRDRHPAERAGRRRRHGHQPGAAARPDRGRRGPGAGRGPVRARGHRPGWAR